MSQEELSGIPSRIQNFQSNFLDCDKCTLSTKDNSYDDRYEPAIGITFENDYIPILSYLINQYMYRNLVSKLIGSKGET